MAFNSCRQTTSGCAFSSSDVRWSARRAARRVRRGGDDWLRWAEEWATRDLEREIKKRLREIESGEATSSLTEAERALWSLRQVYYRQRERVADGDSWAGTAEELGLSSPVDTELPWPPSVYLTPSGFEATLELGDGRIAHIAEDGRTWVSD